MQTLIYFLIWGAFFLFIMRFGCGAHVMGHRSGHHHDGEKPGTSQSPGSGNTPKSLEQRNEH